MDTLDASEMALVSQCKPEEKKHLGDQRQDGNIDLILYTLRPYTHTCEFQIYLDMLSQSRLLPSK